MNIGGRFWLEDKGKAFVGRGRVELLEKIRDKGSINAAAKSMKMAYKAAWDAVDAINRVASQPVVLRIKGGRSGGGTRLTPYGLALLEGNSVAPESLERVVRYCNEVHTDFVVLADIVSHDIESRVLAA
jgi:molybdate transport system regulatory protein